MRPAARLVMVIAGLLAAFSAGGCAATESPEDAFVREAAEILDEGLYADGDAWREARAELLSAAEHADDVSELLPAVQDALLAAGGEHSFLIEGGDLGDVAVDAPVLPSSRALGGGVSVLKVPSTLAQEDPEVARYLEAGIAAREARVPDAACGWVIDVRGNRGGNMYPMLAILAPFLDTETPMSVRSREGDIREVTVGEGRVEVPGDDDPYVVEYDPESSILEPPAIVLLHDDESASAAEAVVAAFLGQDDVVTAGESTAGLSTWNDTIPLSDGSTLVLTTAVYTTRDGAVLGGPIEPEVPLTAAGDATLEGAAALLRESCG